MNLGGDFRNKISIHALREEGDVCGAHQRWAPRAFLSTPSVRRATYWWQVGPADYIFLSTPSVRRATFAEFEVLPDGNNFYPRPP